MIWPINDKNSSSYRKPVKTCIFGRRKIWRKHIEKNHIDETLYPTKVSIFDPSKEHFAATLLAIDVEDCCKALSLSKDNYRLYLVRPQN